MLNLKQFARKLLGSEGAEIAEVAVVLPVAFMFLLGIIWFGRAFNIYSTIQQAAQQGAITAARATCATCGDAASKDGSVTSCDKIKSDGSVASTVSAVMCASSIDPTQMVTNTIAVPTHFCTIPPNPEKCSAAGNIAICRDVLLNPPASSTVPPQCGAVVSFQYPYQFYLPFTSLNMQKITLSAQAQSRMEN